ncbi:MAG: hypothetical protein Ct9H300mP6_03900 [Gammaproteobacteria bacterium]|nr:MAG: hypothetical protein Ct9H300mP6_03900 [Gammaproteobacteria bacterium]
MVNAFPYSKEDLGPLLKLAKEFDACFVNIIGGVMPLIIKMLFPWFMIGWKRPIKQGLKSYLKRIGTAY